MNKTYCDICEKEVEYRDSYHLKIEPRTVCVTIPTIQLHEVCKECVEKINVIINQKGGAK